MASTTLTRNMTTQGSSIKGTFSAWVKRSKISLGAGGVDNDIYQHNFSSDYRFCIIFTSDDKLRIGDYRSNAGGWVMKKDTNALYRDTNGWYHIYVVIDRSLATAEDRQKAYVNGERITSWSSSTDYSQQTSGSHSGAVSMNNDYNGIIGGRENSTDYFDGLMSHLYWVDGSVIDIAQFGSTDSTTGEWKINTSPTIASYGTNGHSHFKDVASVTDQSGNSNNFTVASGSLTKTEDCPDNVFATWNGIAANLDTTLTNGNTKVAHGSQLERRPVISALGMSSGKYYAEFKALSGSGGNIEVGIVNRSDPTTQGRYMGQSLQNAGFIAYKFDGVITFDGTDTTGFTTTATNDILGVAVDIDNTRIYFYKNGTLINSGGTSFANMSGGDGDYFFCNGDRSGTSTYSLEANFGNGYFGTTAVSSAGTNASGIGIFEYDVPTGYTALSTKGLNL